jgi:SpoIID/LytB domain protein
MRKLLTAVLLFFHCFLLAKTQYLSEPIVRVRIINGLDTLRLSFINKWILQKETVAALSFEAGEQLVLFAEKQTLKTKFVGGEVKEFFDPFLLRSSTEDGSLKIKNVPFGVGWWWESKEDRIYEGEIHFYTVANKIEAVIHLPLEQYLKGVVPYEIGNNSPLDALKAQAVAARSEAIMALNSKLYSGEHYDLTSDVECQVFSGNGKRTSLSDQAVEETRGIILSENGNPINAYYASNCGGHSELIKNVWGDRRGVESYSISNFDSQETYSLDLSNESVLREWLFSSPQSNCNPNTTSGLPNWSQNNFRWKAEYTNESISKMISKERALGNLLEIKILQRGESGRAINSKFVFEKDSIITTGELKIRQLFSPPLRSSCFVVDKTDSGFVLHGAGWGHGVGMCQSGAIGMAKNGKSFEEILKHYYRKANLTKIF